MTPGLKQRAHSCKYEQKSTFTSNCWNSNNYRTVSCRNYWNL